VGCVGSKEEGRDMFTTAFGHAGIGTVGWRG